MAQAAVNIRMDADLKEDMNKTCKNMGLSMTSAFTLFAKKVTREQRIPFEITSDSFYETNNIKDLESRALDSSKNKNMEAHDLIEA